MGPAPEAGSSGGGIERRYPEASAMPVLARAADCGGASALDAVAKAPPGENWGGRRPERGDLPSEDGVRPSFQSVRPIPLLEKAAAGVDIEGPQSSS